MQRACVALAPTLMDEVLLVDDDPAMLSILEGILTGARYACLTSTNAAEALQLIAKRPSIALVVSDVLMPGLSGLDFVQRLNTLTLERAPPRVLLLTAHPTVEIAVDAFRLGARDFLVKPIRPPELIEAVERVMTQAGADRAAHAARPPEVEQLMRQAEELAGRLRRLAFTNEPAATPARVARQTGGASTVRPAKERAAAARADAAPGAMPIFVLDTIEQLRRLRDRYEPHKLDDVAWDLLLELLRAERLHQRLSVSGLTISINGVSPTTSLRRVNELVARGYIARLPDPRDARRDFVSLTPKSKDLLADYLACANARLHDLTGEMQGIAAR